MIVRSRRIVAEEGRVLDGWIRVEAGTIAEIGTVEPPGSPPDLMDLGDRWVGPGFIDIHIHGAGESDVMDGTSSSIERMAVLLAESGVTAFVPTTYSSPVDVTLRALRSIQAVKVAGSGGAAVLGAHMEGPFLSAARKGAHRPEYLRAPSMREVERYREAADILIVVVAPELEGGSALIGSLVDEGVVVAIGHTDAEAAQVADAAAAGARLVTHLFNGMPQLHHRRVGPVGAALVSPSLVCEIIGDGIHLSAEAMRLALAAKGISGIVLVSDAGRGAGTSDEAGAITLPGGTLASSLALLPTGFVRFCRATGLDVAAGWGAASGNAARLLGLNRKGVIAVGADADFTVLEADGRVTGGVVGGIPYFAAP